MTGWQVALASWAGLALLRFAFFASKSLYLVRVRSAVLDYHEAVRERRRSRHENWLRKQRRTVQSLLYESGQYEDGPSPSDGGRATKLNLYALESLEHWLSEHPKGMARTREALSKAIRLYLIRGVRGLNPLYWFGWLFFFPSKVADRIGVAGSPEWGDSLRLLYWTLLAGGAVVFLIFFLR